MAPLLYPATGPLLSLPHELISGTFDELSTPDLIKHMFIRLAFRARIDRRYAGQGNGLEERLGNGLRNSLWHGVEDGLQEALKDGPGDGLKGP